MHSNEKVIEYLNKALSAELAAIHQYFLHAKLLADWGYNKLAEHEKKESIEEMRHADILMERILFLKGMPKVEIAPMQIGANVEKILKGDLFLEKEAIALLKEAIAHCEKVSDYGTRDLFLKMLQDEEEHHDYLETQLNLIKEMGLQNYLPLQV